MSKKLLQIILGVFVFTYMYHCYPTNPKSSNSSEAYKLAEIEKSYPDLVMSHGSKDSKYIALSFDDGPDNLITPKVLDVLSMEHVKATFFIVGKQAQANPAVVKRIVSEGHSIGNHSWSHPEFQKLNDEESSQEINRTEKLLFELTGKKTALFRPPYGFITEDQVQYLG